MAVDMKNRNNMHIELLNLTSMNEYHKNLFSYFIILEDYFLYLGI